MGSDWFGAVIFLVTLSALILIYLLYVRKNKKEKASPEPIPQGPAAAKTPTPDSYVVMGDNDRERELIAKIRELGLTHQTSIQRVGGRSGKGIYFAVLPSPSESDERIVETEMHKEDYFGNPDGMKKLKYSVLSGPKEDSPAIRVAKSIVELTKEVAQKHGCRPYYAGPSMIVGGALVMYFGLGDEPVTKNPA